MKAFGLIGLLITLLLVAFLTHRAATPPARQPLEVQNGPVSTPVSTPGEQAKQVAAQITEAQAAAVRTRQQQLDDTGK